MIHILLFLDVNLIEMQDPLLWLSHYPLTLLTTVLTISKAPPNANLSYSTLSNHASCGTTFSVSPVERRRLQQRGRREMNRQSAPVFQLSDLPVFANKQPFFFTSR